MSKQQSTGDDPQIGVSPSEVEENDDADVAEALGMSVGAVDPEAQDETVEDLVGQLGDRDVDPVVATLLETLVDETRRLRERVDELEDDQEKTHDVATNAVALAQTNESDVEDLDEREEQTREIARSAIAKAEQVDADPDQQEDAEELPAGVEPSSSPLDFFANCREEKIRQMFVENSNRSNTFRAIKVAKRWPEFAREAWGNEDVQFTREDLETALTAVLGEKPHRQTITRVWDTLKNDIGGDDVRELTPQYTSRDVAVLEIDREAAEGLLDKRYIGLDLLDGSEDKATTGGVTPVVTGDSE